MSPVRFLFGASAVVRVIRDRDVGGRWQPHISAGVVGLCRITELELLYSARSKADREERLELFLIVAATAELNRLTLVHYGHDFDEIVNVTAQPASWLAQRGTIA